jgi:hypothetical protein
MLHTSLYPDTGGDPPGKLHRSDYQRAGFTQFSTRRPAFAAPSLSFFFYSFLNGSNDLALFGEVVELCNSEREG